MEILIATIVSLLTQLAKKIADKYGFCKDTTRTLMFLGISFLVSVIYFSLDKYSPGLLETIISVTLYASGIYILFIKKIGEMKNNG
jgi:hypothetical protein